MTSRNSNILKGKCKLCLFRNPDKTGSHIISKFLTKRVYKPIENQRAWSIYNNGKLKRTQSSPKEDHLICSNCEKRLGSLETICSGEIQKIHNFKRNISDFELKNVFRNEILICPNINKIAFDLFIYSLFWRCSISTLNEFENFLLNDNTLNILRQYLDENLKYTVKDLKTTLLISTERCKFDYIVIKPISIDNGSIGKESAFSINDNEFYIFTGDFIFIFFPSSNKLKPAFKLLSNKKSKFLKILIAKNENWTKLNNTLNNFVPLNTIKANLYN